MNPTKIAAVLGLLIATVLLGAAIADCSNRKAEAARVHQCAEGKFQYQVLNDCTLLNNCTFTPKDLAHVRNLTQHCRRGE